MPKGSRGLKRLRDNGDATEADVTRESGDVRRRASVMFAGPWIGTPHWFHVPKACACARISAIMNNLIPSPACGRGERYFVAPSGSKVPKLMPNPLSVNEASPALQQNERCPLTPRHF